MEVTEAAVASVATVVVVVGEATLEVEVGVTVAVEVTLVVEVAALHVEIEVGSEVIGVGFEVIEAEAVAEVPRKKLWSSSKTELSSY